MHEDVRIPTTIDGRIFQDEKMYVALRNCEREHHRPLFMTEVAEALSMSQEDSRLWRPGITTPSVQVTGKTNRGNNVVVFAHIPNYFSKPKSIQRAISNGLVDGAGQYPQCEFEYLLSKEDGKNVFVVDYTVLVDASQKMYDSFNLEKHPMVIPFLGAAAEQYLSNASSLKMRITFQQDLHEKPYARLLQISTVEDDMEVLTVHELSAAHPLDGAGRFLARKPRSLTPLERLAGKGTDVGRGLIVLYSEALDDVQYQKLTYNPPLMRSRRQ
ncbi:hypothetical protein C4573_03545 [Candidatus Woesearchaeota archaeon]|nr:MAG: hypothetical protein C4573_03545 [Candidatus Woesearchaeota archaeon]